MKEEKDNVVEILLKFFPDPPCNYNNMDELTLNEWCENNCSYVTERECWRHAIKEKWYNKMSSG